jgi:hypothetical protein
MGCLGQYVYFVFALMSRLLVNVRFLAPWRCIKPCAAWLDAHVHSLAHAVVTRVHNVYAAHCT